MTDAFQLLGVEPAFDLDLGALEQRHRELSRALHPDRYVGRPAAERRQALGKAIEVNAGWRALRDPVHRAEVLLQRLGVPIAERPEPASDPELLMQMMEWREALSEARRAADADAVERIITAVRAREAEVVERLARGFRVALAAAAGNPAGSVVLDDLVEQLAELRYYRKLLDDAAVIVDELL